MNVIYKIAELGTMNKKYGKEEFYKNMKKYFSQKEYNLMNPGHIENGEGVYVSYYDSKDKLIGIASITKTKQGENKYRTGGFITIGVTDDFKSKGMSKKILKDISSSSGYDDVYASIDKSNIKSIRLHRGLGFVESSEERKKFLRSIGVVDDNHIRLHKKMR